jgi:subtilisin-like proprotein convertase family protein
MPIPDNQAPGARSVIHFDEAGLISDIAVSLDITHAWVGDLLVRMAAPSGTVITLHQRAGGGTPDLKRTFDVGTLPVLGGLLGQSLRGDWLLTVEDQAPRDVGTLNSWEIGIEARLLRFSEASRVGRLARTEKQSSLF